MPAYIHHIETLVPEFVYSQAQAAMQMRTWLTALDPRAARAIERVHRTSGIDTRHSVLADFTPAAAHPLFRLDSDGRPINPGTGERNERFATEARRLAVSVSQRALQHGPRTILPAGISHLITTSCTGFFNPGPDYFILRDLGLSPRVQRYALGFMGCYAALPALRMAAQFCQADPSAAVLVVAVELCTLHLRLEGGMDALVANAIFADGAAAALISARPPAPGRSGYRLEHFASALIPSGERELTWRIGDHGFEITLSAYVPDVIGSNLKSLIEPLFAAAGMDPEQIGRWAVHPGGRAILDRVQENLQLAPEQIRSSRDVLRQFGNMSSASLLFVLRNMIENGAHRQEESVCALGFGPGLTVEMALLRLLGT